MAGLDAIAFSAVFKRHYTAEEIQMLTYKNRPMLALLEKDEDFGGDVLPVPIGYANPQGRSATFSNALANQTPSKYKSWLLTPVNNYATVNIDRRTMKASEKAPHDAWIKARISETDNAVDSVANDIAIDLFGDGSGSRGVISSGSTVASLTIQLATNRDIQKFEVGQFIVAGPNANGTSLRTGSAQITSINRDVTTTGGTLTTGSNWSTQITGLSTGDYLFVQGDATLKAAGLGAWLPSVRPVAGDNFFGVDRSADVTRLAGVYYDGSALSIEEAFIQGLAVSNQEGGVPDYGFCNFRQWANLETALGSRVRYMETDLQNARFGMRGIMLNGPTGPVNILADRYCPDLTAYLLQMDTWTLYSTGPSPAIVDEDGIVLLRSQTTDGFDVRVASYHNLACRAPGKNTRLNLPS